MGVKMQAAEHCCDGMERMLGEWGGPFNLPYQVDEERKTLKPGPYTLTVFNLDEDDVTMKDTSTLVLNYCPICGTKIRHEGPYRSEGVMRIQEERRRQIEEEGWTPEHDDQHDAGQLAIAAACYLVEGLPNIKLGEEIQREHGRFTIEAWPFGARWDKRKKHDRIRRLEIAGALIAAEIDRLRRLEGEQNSE